MPRCSPPGRAECVAPGPLWCPWSAPGCLRCLRPSGGVVSRSQRPQFSSCCCRWRVRRACGGAGKGGPPCPLLWGCGRLVVPWHASCWGCVCGQDLAGCVSGRAGPSQRCGAWPAEGCCFFAQHAVPVSAPLVAPVGARGSFRAVMGAWPVWRGKGGPLVGPWPRALRTALLPVPYRGPTPAPRPLGAFGTPFRGARSGERMGGGDVPSVRKPSLAIREGALGYRNPQLPPLLCA